MSAKREMRKVLNFHHPRASWACPEYWEGRADECRALADAMEHEEPQRHMNGIAEQYEALARWARSQISTH
jgi:hypothetical protein